MNLENRKKGLSCNEDKEDKAAEHAEEECNKAQAKQFRGTTARMNYISQDSPGLQFGVKQASKDMARPKRGSWDSLKKLGRFMVFWGRVVWKFRWQAQPRYGDTYRDSD